MDSEEVVDGAEEVVEEVDGAEGEEVDGAEEQVDGAVASEPPQLLPCMQSPCPTPPPPGNRMAVRTGCMLSDYVIFRRGGTGRFHAGAKRQ